ncbi:MAG: 16S rRNA (guanine(527)-N(7))-methyltransferase RsmG [Bacteroidales bacterium]|nr:16S rRNA (guanine(527)-N(7))-methyltransferase RsmG [Bacteroidales bacterium]
MNIDCIERYFPELNTTQKEQITALYDLYADWNSKINVISRKDIENLYERHVLHSMGISKLLHFKDGSNIMDVGTGGGFPAIPLAILYPNVHFHLVDSINKKLIVAHEVSGAIGLKNISIRHCRVEEEKSLFDFVISRAVMSFPDLVKLCKKNIGKEQKNSIPNGLICLKGGELGHEIASFKNKVIMIELSDYFKEEFFKTKKVVYVPLV